MRYMKKRIMAFALSLSVAASVTGPTTAVMAAEEEGYLEAQDYISGELMDEVDEVSEDEDLVFSGIEESAIYEGAAEGDFEEADSADAVDAADEGGAFDDGFEGLIEDTDMDDGTDAEAAALEAVTFYADETADPSSMAFDYDGETEDFIKADGTSFGMYSRQDGSSITLENGKVKVIRSPSNTTVYTGFYLNADITDSSTWKQENFYPANEDGNLEFTLSTDYCGKAWPVAPIKKKDQKTTSTQYYLAIPKLETLRAQKLASMVFDYSGETEDFIKADGSSFGMFGRMDKSDITLEDDQVKIIRYISNTKKTYAGFYLQADITDSGTWKEDYYIPACEDGHYEFTLSTEYCGKAWPVAPVKTSDMTKTTSAQYYLGIPTLETLQAKKAAEDKAAADAVSEQLSGLKEDAALEDAAAVEAAREAYEALTEDQKKLVDAAALAKLKAAEASVTAAADKAEQEEKEKEEAEKKAQQEKEEAEKKAQQEKAAKEAADIANAKAAFKLNVTSNETLPLKKKQVSTAVTATLADGDQLASAVSNKENVVKASVVGNKVRLAAANKTGTATVTVTTVKGGEASFKVKVQKKAVVAKKAQGLKKKLSLKKGEKRALGVVIKPITTPGKVKVTSSNKKVAVVKNGVLTAKKAGKTVITYKAGKKNFKCVVTVK